MAKAIADVCVKVGTKADGKGRYENVGAQWLKDTNEEKCSKCGHIKGAKFVTIKRTFSPAGVPNPDNKDNIILSIFDKKDNNDQQTVNQEEE